MQSGVYILADSSLHIVIALGVCDPSLMQRERYVMQKQEPFINRQCSLEVKMFSHLCYELLPISNLLYGAALEFGKSASVCDVLKLGSMKDS